MDSRIAVSVSCPAFDCEPGGPVVSRDAVEIAKDLRAAGYAVDLGGRNEAPRYYKRAGLSQLLRDPVVITFVLPVFTSTLGGVAADLISHLLLAVRARGAQVVLRSIGRHTEADGTQHEHEQFLQSDGTPMAPSEVEAWFNAARANHSAFFEDQERLRSPDPSRPGRVYLEHTSRHVGWANVQRRGGQTEADIAIVDRDAVRPLQSNGQVGISVAGPARSMVCSVCQNNYMVCAHRAGETYDGIQCVVEVGGLQVRELSIVRDPINADCVAMLGDGF